MTEAVLGRRLGAEMAARRNRLRTAYLKRVFHDDQDDTWVALTDAANLWVSLHTADPGLAGDQNTSEATYGGYTRISVARSSSAWTLTGADQMAPTGAVLFPVSTSSGQQAITHYGIGLEETGAGRLLWSFQLLDVRTVVSDYQPQFLAGTLITTAA